MRAAKWDLEDAKKRIKATMEWRRDYKPDLIPPDEVSIEIGYTLQDSRMNDVILSQVKIEDEGGKMYGDFLSPFVVF